MKKDKAKKLITSTLSAAMMLSIASGPMTAFASENEVKEQVVDNASEKQAKTAGTAFDNSTEGRKVSAPTTSAGLTIECYEDISIPANYQTHVSIWEGVTIRDAEGRDITEHIDVKGSDEYGIEHLGYAMQEVQGKVDFKKPGVYPVTYVLTDKTGDEPVTTEVTRNVTITENKLPEFVGGEDVTIKVGEKFNPRDGISAIDAESGDVTSRIKWCGSVDTNTPGEYVLKYGVYDGENCNDEARIVRKTRVITVVADEAVAPEVETPEVEGEKEVTVEKYDNSLSSDLKVSKEEIKSITNNGGNHSTSVIGNAIDGNENTFWETSKPNSSSFTNEVIVELEETQTIDTLLYGARKKGAIVGKGFSKDLEIYVSSTSEGDNFELVGNAKYEGSIKDTVKIGFEPTQAKRIKLVLKDAYKDWTSISELGLYKAEGQLETADENDSDVATPAENTAPVLNGVEHKTIKVGDLFSVLQGVSANDKEDGDISNKIQLEGMVNIDKPGVYPLTYKVTDSKGAQTVVVRNITVEGSGEETPAPAENTAPVLTGVEDLEIIEGTVSYFNIYGGVGATDKEDGRLNHLVKAKGGVDVNVPGEYKITYTVTDSQGLTTERVRTITVVNPEEVSPENNTAPVFKGIEDMTIRVGDYSGPYMDQLYGIKAIDKEDGDISRKIEMLGVVKVDVPGVYKVRYSVRDSHGIMQYATRTITVLPKEGDVTPEVPADQNAAPVFHGVKDIAVTVGERVSPLIGITVSDREDGALTRIGVCGPLTPSQMLDTSKPGRIKVKYSVKDKDGLVSYAERYMYVLEKDEAPKFNGVEDTTIKLGTTFDALKGITANDKEDGVLTHNIKSNGTVDTSKEGVYPVTYKIVDSRGNETTIVRNITVSQNVEAPEVTVKPEVPVAPVGNTAPVLNGVEHKTIKVGDLFSVLQGVSANDKEDGDISNKIQLEGMVNIDKPGVYPLTYKVTDSKGAQTVVVRNITVEGSGEETPAPAENTAPVLTGVEDLEIIEGTVSYFNIYGGVGATDKEDGRLNHLVKAKGGVDVNVPGEYKITYTVTDSQGLTTERVRTITVVKKEEVSQENNTAPVLSGIEDMTIKVGEYFTFDSLYGVKAIDKQDGDISKKIQKLGVVKADVPGVYKVRYSVKDSQGLIQYATRTITVLSKEGNLTPEPTPEVPLDQNAAPVFHGLNDIAVTVGERVSPTVGVSASDREDGALTKIGACGPFTSSCMLDTSKPGRVKVKYSVTDKDGLTSFGERYIYILEKDEAPTFNGVEDTTIKLGTTFDALKGITANDKEDGILTHNIKSEGTVDTAKEGVYPVTYKIMDSRGNETTIVRNITVSKNAEVPAENTAPVLNGIADVTITAGEAFDKLSGITASDKEDGNISDRIKVAGNVDTTKAGQYKLTYTVVDSLGLKTNVERTVTVLENNAPVLSGIADITITAGEAFDKLSGITASDKEDGNISDRIKVAGNVDTSKAGQYKLTYTVVDSLGLKTNVERTVTVLAKVIGNAPVLTVNDMSFQIGKRMNLLKGVTAIDVEDGDIRSQIQTSFSNFDPSTPGVYDMTYSVTDSDGNLVEKDIKITIFE